MTKEEFDEKLNNWGLVAEMAQFIYDSYPDHVTVEDFEEYMVTE